MITSINRGKQGTNTRERSLFMGGGPVQIGGGINFSASKLRGGGGKISVQAFRGGAKFQCTDI